MSDDVPTIESQLISTQVEQDLKLIGELPLDQKRSSGDANVSRHEF
jgi:hypothetical protein